MSKILKFETNDHIQSIDIAETKSNKNITK